VWGFVVRDHEGQPILAGAGRLDRTHDALMAETMACQQALEAAEHFGISQIELAETDSYQLKEAFTTPASDLALGGNLFKTFVLFSLIILIVPKFVTFRSCNSSAHELAKRGMRLGPRSIMSGRTPSRNL